jgi:hypothetical protein
MAVVWSHRGGEWQCCSCGLIVEVNGSGCSYGLIVEVNAVVWYRIGGEWGWLNLWSHRGGE